MLERVRAGNIQHNWATITAANSAHTVELEVSEDALRVGTVVDAARITVNASTAQRIADHLDAMLLTPRMADLIRQQAEIPAGFVDVDALKAGEAGITTHNAVSLAFKRSTHTDPGPGFPIHRYLAMVREYLVNPEPLVA